VSRDPARILRLVIIEIEQYNPNHNDLKGNSIVYSIFGVRS